MKLYNIQPKFTLFMLDEILAVFDKGCKGRW